MDDADVGASMLQRSSSAPLPSFEVYRNDMQDGGKRVDKFDLDDADVGASVLQRSCSAPLPSLEVHRNDIRDGGKRVDKFDLDDADVGASVLQRSCSAPLPSLEREITEVPDDDHQPPPLPPPAEVRPRLISQRNNNRLFPTATVLCYLLAIIGGLSIGFSLNMTGGLLAMRPYLKKLSESVYIKTRRSESTTFCAYTNQGVLLFSSLVHLLASMSIWFGHKLCFWWGRKPTLIISSTIFLVGVGCVAWFPVSTIETVGMVAIGIGMGFLRQIISVICNEIPSPDKRGNIILFNKISIVGGGTLAFLINYIGSGMLDWGWRVTPMVLLGIISLLIPISLYINESPNFFMERGEREKARNALQNIRGSSDISDELEELDKIALRVITIQPIRELWQDDSRPIFLINTLAKILPQLSTINSLVFFGPYIFRSFQLAYQHVSLRASFLFAFISSLVGLIVTCISAYGVTIFGRRRALIGSFVGICIIKIVTFLLLLRPINRFYVEDAKAYAVSSLLLADVVVTSVLTNPSGWISVGLPDHFRAFGDVSIGCSDMITTFIINQLIVRMLCFFQAYCFLFLGCISVVGVIFTCLMVPETTGISKESIGEEVWRKHWLWKKMMKEETVSV